MLQGYRKYLNEFVQYQHLKMESLFGLFKIIKPNAWVASVNLKDAFFTVQIHESHQKCFKFQKIMKRISKITLVFGSKCLFKYSTVALYPSTLGTALSIISRI